MKFTLRHPLLWAAALVVSASALANAQTVRIVSTGESVPGGGSFSAFSDRKSVV